MVTEASGEDAIEGYIESCPEQARAALREVRQVVREAAPQAVESIAYKMPAYKVNGKPLVYFAGYAKHIGFYATPNGHEEFADEFAGYKQGKGSVQFPLDQPMPLDLIKRVVEFRLGELG